MKDKLIIAFERLNVQKKKVGPEYRFPIWRDMERIQYVLRVRYGFIVNYN